MILSPKDVYFIVTMVLLFEIVCVCFFNRWDDDVVFRNQTRNEPKKQKRFINDTIRSDFHKRFLNKYIK